MIKRPLAWMALAQIMGIAGAAYGVTWLPAVYAVIVIGLSLMRLCHDRQLFNQSFRQFNQIITVILILFFILAGVHTAQRCINSTYPKDISQISGRVTKIRSNSTGIQLQISCSPQTGANAIHKAVTHYGLIVYVPYGTAECHEGDTILVSGRISDFETSMNPGEFDAKKYYASLNIKGKMNADSLCVIRYNENQFIRLIFAIKAVVQESIIRCAGPEDAGIIISMLLGDKSELGSEINLLYQKSGIAHILAISGLHISIIGMTLYRLLRKAGLRFGSASVASCVIIAGYGIMTGNAVSAIRAFVMFAVTCGAQVLGRKYDMTCAVSLASIMILSEMPLMLTNSGYLLSFGAIIALIKVQPVIYKIMEEFIAATGISKNDTAAAMAKAVIRALSASISVSLVTLPVLLMSFGEFPLLSVIINLAVIPLMGLVMAGGITAGAAGIFNVYAGRFLMGVVHYTLLLFRKMCELSVLADWSHVIPGRPGTYKLIIYYMLLMVLLVIHACVSGHAHISETACVSGHAHVGRFSAVRKHLYGRNLCTGKMLQITGRRFCSIAVIIIMAMLMIMFFNPVRYLTIRMMYVGQGDGIYIRVPDGTDILMDSGSTDKKKLGEYTLVPALKAGGISSLDYAVISHLDEDHYNGILYLIQNQVSTGIRVCNLIVPDVPENEVYDVIVRTAEENRTNVINACRGMKIEAMNGHFVMKCIAPDDAGAYSDKNEGSLIMNITYGRFAMLFTGDVQGKGEKNLTEMLSEAGTQTTDTASVRYNVLKVAHHGSSGSTSGEFLEQVRPDIALISCGVNNRYRHPHDETLERLYEAGAAIVRTDENGAITLKTDGRKYMVEVFR